MVRRGVPIFGALLSLLITGSLMAQTVSGTVFRDYNANGQADTFEAGVEAVTVTAYDSTGAIVGSGPTIADGTYNLPLSVGPGTGIRVEFTGLPAYLVTGPEGPDSGSTVTFALSGDTGIDLGVNNPGDYCQATPELATNCYIFGDQTGSGLDALVSFGYLSGNSGASSSPGDYTATHSVEGTAGQVGSTWGLAYQGASDSLFAGAYMKRHSGYGPSGPGAIYRIDRGLSSVSTFLDLNTLFPGSAGADSHPPGTNFDIDGASWDEVGKTALGGMDLSDDETTLYVMNLFDRQLYEIPIGLTPSAPLAGDISAHAVPTPAGCDPGDVRPFAVKVKDGLVYVGIVCSAQSTGDAADLMGYVYAFDPGSANFTEVLQFPLNYTRGCANVASFAGCDASQPGDWQPWRSTFGGFPIPNTGYSTIVGAQPMLSDIEFDNGVMIVGIRDRMGDQTGFKNQDTAGGPTLYIGISAGDMLRACPDGLGGWTMESNGSCGGVATSGASNGEGPGGGEFYFSEFFREGGGSNFVHAETSLGGLAQIPGHGNVLTTVFDPIINAGAPNFAVIYDGGVHHYDNGTAALSHAIRVYDGPGPSGSSSFFGKANGLGDLEALCEPAPIEIGNRVWDDTNGNGVQDPGEPGLANIDVTLFSSGAGINVTVQTDGNGNYLFNSSTIGQDVPTEESFEIRIDPTQGNLGGRLPTRANNGSNDLHDSDGTVSGPFVVVSFTTGAAGANNHSYDFGFGLPGSIGDYVWEDVNGDGAQTGESGIFNVTLDLIYDADGSGDESPGDTVEDTQTTDGSGLYDFSGILPGNYLVKVTDTNTVLTGYSLTGGTQPHVKALGSGEDYNDADFGYQLPILLGTIGDYVWLDENGDGVQDGSESGIFNVTLDLIDDANGNGVIDGGESVLDTQTTDGSGNYSFSNLSAGDYIVTVTDTNGALTDLILTGGTTPYAISLLAGATDLTADFGYDDPGNSSIGDYVWADEDGAGDQDGSESGIFNVTVDLVLDANSNGVIDGGDSTLTTQTTNASGFYNFTGLDAGSYIVTVTDTNGALTGLVLTGGPEPHAVSLAMNDAYDTADFGYNDPGDASIGDYVWADDNGDGVQDGSESGIENVTLDLIDDANGNGVIDGGEAVLATQTTNASGIYGFTGLDAGNYIVSVTDTNAVLTGLNLTGGTQPHAVSLAISQNYDTADFGYQDPGGGSIGDYVWADDNADGIQDGSETGIANVTLDLVDDTNGNGVIDGGEPVLDTATTDINGNYSFTGLAAGDYVVSVTDTHGELTGLNLTGGPQPHAVSLAANEDYTAADFGYNDPSDGSIGDFVWRDTNGDGTQDSGEPGIANVTLNLIDDINGNGVADPGEPVLDTQTTDGTGNYQFPNLPAGNYLVHVTDTNGELTEMNLTGGTNPHPTTLAVSQGYRDADFGYTPPPVLGAAKFAGVVTNPGKGTYSVTYSFVIENLGLVTASGVQATDNMLATFPDPLTFSVEAISATGLTANTNYDGLADTNLLTGVDSLGAGEVATIELTIHFQPASQLGPFMNQATVTGNGPDGTPTEDPSDNGSDPDPNGDGNPNEPGENDPTPVEVPGSPQVEATKRDVLVVDNNGDGMADPGDRLRYDVVITNTGATDALNAVFTSGVDPNTDLVIGTVTTDQGTVTSGNNPGDVSVAVDMGTVVANTGEVRISFTVEIQAPLPKTVTEVVCQGTVSGDNFPDEPTDDPDTNPDDDPTITPIEGAPLVEAYKSDAILIDNNGDGLANPGDSLRYTVTMDNSGTRPATAVIFTSGVDPHTDLVVGSVTTSQGTVTEGNDPGDLAIEVSLGTLDVGSTVTIGFDVQIHDPLDASVTQVVCQGLVTGDNIPDEPTDDPETPEDDDPTVEPVFMTPVVSITKTNSLLIDNNQNGLLDPGETLQYEIVITNLGPVVALDAVLTDIPDPHTTLVSGTVNPDKGVVTLGNSPGDLEIEVELGDLAVDEVVVITFNVTVNLNLGDGMVTIVNQAFVDGSNFEERPSDDPNTTTGDDPTVITLSVVPTLGEAALLIFILLFMALGLKAIRQGKRQDLI